LSGSQQSFDFVHPFEPPGRVESIPFGDGSIVVGTCGYSYKDWVGPFYPQSIKSNGMLPYYAERFPAVEIDASYYRVPSEATFASMDARTPADFRFAAKLPGSVTHLPAEDAHRVPDDARLFRENIEPLVRSGKLGAVLMQFPHSFTATPRAENYLRSVREELVGFPLVAEFRNREWQRNATLELLAELDVGWCNVDEPQFEKLLQPSSDVVGPLAYVRFHGRNYKNWWRGSAETRYEYDYTEEELAPWTERVAEMAAQTKQTYVFFNNHRLGQAAKNAGTFARMLLAGIGS
jgi:uncharacterized protein YecE (DUF72 family)